MVIPFVVVRSEVLSRVASLFVLVVPAYKLVRPIAAMAKDISPTTVRAR